MLREKKKKGKGSDDDERTRRRQNIKKKKSFDLIKIVRLDYWDAVEIITQLE